MSRGGARPGAGRPPKRAGVAAKEDVLADVERVTPPATLEALFTDARAGDVRALRMLSAIFDGAEQRALREQGPANERQSYASHNAAKPTSRGDGAVSSTEDLF